MTFTVNDNGLLESSELRAVVSSNQDIGTLYGLQTKLVLEDVANQRERSILVPRGAVRIAKRSNHVQVDIDTPGEVAVSCCRFSLNAFLRRLDCRAELRDVYYKAYLHAITSFVLPDPFTGRTGTEMALDCLKSGLAQLTVPLDSESIKTLVALACLTPRRLYYPSHLQVMQTVEWSPALSAAAQHDDFNIAVNTIFARSALYLPFHTDLKTHIEPLLSRGNSHLLLRARSRHSTYRNAQCTFSLPKSVQDTRYTPRDKNRGSEGSLRVFEIASLVRQWSSNIDVAQNLCERFSLWNRISGYGNPFRETSLDKILHLDFAELWGSLFQMCQRSVQFKDTFKLMFLFSTISFGNNVDMPMLRTLMAVAFVPSIRAMKVPQWSSYVGFRDGEVPTEAELQVLMQATFVISRNTRKKPIAERLAAQVRFRAKCTATKDFAQFLIRQWPCLEPSRTGYGDSNLISIDAALNAVKAEWSRLFVNSRLAEHLRELQEYLKDCQARTFFRPVSIAVPIEVVHPALGSVEAAPSLRNLLRRMIRGPLLRKCAQVLSGTESERSEQNYDDNGSEAWQLRSIVTRIKSDPNQIRSRYGNDLWQSLNALKIAANSMEHKPRVIDIESTLHAIQVLEKNVQKHFEVLVVSLQHSNDFEWLSLGDQWPRTTPTTLLESLRKCVPDILSGVALEAVVEYGESITQLQRAVRIEKALRMNNLVQLNEELLNEGHADWKPKSYPEWLLIEIEANVLIRPEQYNVAVEMISPASGQSTLIQLNMGKGKSSLIIPMIASELADSHRILRIIVPKPLLAQETQVLASRLCGLLGRPLSHIPFSRKTPTDSATISAYWKIHEKSRERRGVIIALPEHILSFKLSGLERMSCGKLEEAVLMLQTQTLLSRNCRDVLDESDHILAVRTQLIYPSGTPIMVDGHPHRWVTSQELLYLVQQHLENLREQYPNGLEVIPRSGGGYPTVHILRKDVEDRLLHLLTKDICEGRTPILPLHKFQAKDLQQIERFVSDSQYMESEGKILLSRMEELLGEDSITKDMLLLRGLLVHRILLLALNKRWNVQYGLDLTRCLMTVPYHAKGIPSANAEFGHPDVAILLTCLSYYNTGLSEDQLRQSLAKVLSMDDPAFEYDQWVLCSAMVPISLRDWHAINLEDEEQVTVLWRCLSHAVKTVNFYMNHFVFPKEARAYQKKLVTNSWDIPLWSEGVGGLSGQDLHIPHQIISQELGITTRGNLALTTGFSGTNDNRSLLPLSIKQRDLPSLLHTNAEVLLYLLQQRNRSYICAVNEQGQRLPVENFLRLITKQSPAINVVLDAGAQVLEMNNYDVVELWLRIETNAEAAVFFSKDDKIMVLYRDGRQESLAASPFVDDLKNCLVYLDESHTRGTDLKLPATSRAALTLGPGQTKDHTVQAAMRLRQLAHEQSIVFFAPPEVNQSILDFTRKSPADFISSYDVVRWILEQTCRGIESQLPLYVAQGLNYLKRNKAARTHPAHTSDTNDRMSYLNILEELERHELKDLYAPRSDALFETVGTANSVRPEDDQISALLKVRDSIQDETLMRQSSAHEQQERELAVEKEQERQVERPKDVQARFHSVHPHVYKFVHGGTVIWNSVAYHDAFEAARCTSVAKSIQGQVSVGGKLLATADFVKTVLLTPNHSPDLYQRPVNWVLWSKTTNVALIISPYEAEKLFDDICASEHVHLIMYAPPVTRKMLCFDTMDFYTVPALPHGWSAPKWLVRALGLFAGRLYFTFAEYDAMAEYLNFQYQSGTQETGARPVARVQPFCQRPIPFVTGWTQIRRNDQDFTQTPMGFLCRSRPLTSDHVFFAPVE